MDKNGNTTLEFVWCFNFIKNILFSMKGSVGHEIFRAKASKAPGIQAYLSSYFYGLRRDPSIILLKILSNGKNTTRVRHT
jgi:hypothetical protein